jgi:hypothetical protein
MYRPPLTIALALFAASCGESATSPYYTPDGPPPAGLIVSLRTAPPPNGATDAMTITADGDSVVAAAVLNASGCSDYRAVAGYVGGVLVVTVVDSLTDRICPLNAAGATFRAVVRPAPRGEYRVEYRARVVPPRQAPSERVVGRQSVRIP